MDLVRAVTRRLRRSSGTVVPMSFGARLPDHVAAVETSDLGTRFHGFLTISQRDQWIKEDPEHREATFAQGPKVLEAWKAFSIVLHADPRKQRKLW